MIGKRILETTSIFLALLGNRPSHCKSQLFFLLGKSASSQYVFASSSSSSFRLPPLDWRLLAAVSLLASVLAAALTAVYSNRAKKTKKMQTPVHKSTACNTILYRHHLCVSDGWERVTDGGGLGRHGEQGGHTKSNPRWHGLGVNPEGEPGDNDEHTGGDVDGEHVVRELTLQRQLHQKAAVLSC